MATVTQPSIRPTNKLTAAIVASATVETTRVLLGHFYPGLFDGPFWLAVYPVVVWAVGFVVKDNDNTP